MEFLRREADRPAGVFQDRVNGAEIAPVATPAKPATPAPPMPQPPLAVSPRPVDAAKPPMSQAPLAVSRRLADALNHASHYHVQFEFDEAGLLVTRPPRDYKPAIQAAERALMGCVDEIKMICQQPERPRHFEDQAWVRAVADSARLGYRRWKED
jgi:hypothetical protein